MWPSLLVLSLSCPAMLAGDTPVQVPQLPAGAQTRWVVAEPEEIVAYLVFDPATVEHLIPPKLRFITLDELAAGGVVWAKEHLIKYPERARWGISFFEIVRMRTFMIDGRAPDWPTHGAAALWLARVAPSDPAVDLGPGRPFLTLGFWIPDREYAAYMVKKGYYANYGEVRLRQGAKGAWIASVKANGLDLAAECRPSGPVTGVAQSAGMQAFFPPRTSSTKDIVRVAFAGHREQVCEKGSIWNFRGTHPLVHAEVLEPASFQFGYRMNGGTYPP